MSITFPKNFQLPNKLLFLESNSITIQLPAKVIQLVIQLQVIELLPSSGYVTRKYTLYSNETHQDSELTLFPGDSGTDRSSQTFQDTTFYEIPSNNFIQRIPP